ncbi:ABC transporter ATP-binding protein [Floricoccus penangensis]|uniref:ABC transporter ATP-binding protein n=1 Tax=Floricoccus penangensis TaxID=1859475 RepID=UPI002041EF5F|nr:ABC transporter ATP-binding protein [Floricoccus penangensis]URZ88122.1 ABC transporter ATP-binding protein/permease [Floricoccus penangensis]
MFSLIRYAKKYKKQIILGPFFKFLEAVFELFLPLLMAVMVDEGILKNDWSKVLQMTFWMIILSIAGLVAAIVCQYYASIASQGFGTEIRNELMKKINKLSYKEINEFGTDTLITRMTNDINQLQLAMAMFIRLVIRAPFLSIGSVVMAFYIDFQIGLIFLALLPIFCVLLYFIIKKSIPLYAKVQAKLDRINELVNQNLSGVRVIRAFARRDTEKKNFNEATDDLSKEYLRVTNISALLSPATTLIMNIGVVAVFYIGGYKVNIGHLQQGQVLALVNYMNQMLLALIVVSELVVIFTRAYASNNRIEEVLATDISVKEASNAKDASGEGDIEFDHVNFRFSDDYGLALEDISFKLPVGQTLGIIGPTASGKTTLTQLISRFYDVSDGSVKVNGLDVRDWKLHDLRKETSIAPQKAVLFSGTIRENLQWGKANASDQECIEALEIAQALDFVEALPNKLDTEIFEGGKNFSGGQKQRLAIARAVIAKSNILILDDSLSALDYQTDLQLRTALKGIDSTLIIISQRLKSIEDADQILVLDNGRMAGLGTHEELMRTCKLYQEIAKSQEEEDDEE